jgi:hypothetical protein
MGGRITQVLTGDHQRIDGLLARALQGDRDSYEELRGALLRHIGIEEKIVFPAIRAAGREVTNDAQLRLDHSAIVAMLVPSPTPEILAKLEELLRVHDALEEGADGTYALADEVIADVDDVVDRLERAPAPPVARHFDGPRAFAAIESLLARAKQGRERARW